MRSRIAFATLALLLVLPVASLRAEKAVLLVRHAEKATDGGKDPELSAAGRERAVRLAEMLKAAGVTHVFVSDTKRSAATGEPFVKAAGLTPRVVPGGDPGATLKEIDAAPADAVVLVVGHSNTIPELLQRLGAAGKTVIADDDYGNLFVVVRGKESSPAVIRLRF